MLTQDGFQFTHLHGTVRGLTPFELPLRVAHYPNVIGEQHLVDQTKGRDLEAEYTLDGFVSEAALEAALDTLHSRAGRLTGDLEVSGGPTYPDCTFLGYEERERFVDGAGVNGWISRGVLRWRQRKRNTG